MYGPYPSTFDPILWALKCTDAGAPAAVDATALRMAKMLEERVHEEVDGEGDLRVDLAYLRISGTLAEAVELRAQAVRKGVPEQFLSLLDALIVEMKIALRVAPRPTRVSESAPEPKPADVEVADWARPDKVLMVEFDYAELING